jgi:hypothetical protein
MTKQLSKFTAQIRVNAWRAVARPTGDKKAQGGEAISMQHRMSMHPVVKVTVVEGQDDRLRRQRSTSQIRTQLSGAHRLVTRVRKIGHLSRKAIGGDRNHSR